MKLKIVDIISLWEPLLKLAEREIPIKIAFKLGRLIKTLEIERRLIEEHKIKLLQKYGVADSETLVIPNDKQKDFLGEWNSFIETEIEVNIEPLNLDFFDEISYVNMTSKEMANLYVLTEESINEKLNK